MNGYLVVFSRHIGGNSHGYDDGIAVGDGSGVERSVVTSGTSTVVLVHNV